MLNFSPMARFASGSLAAVCFWALVGSAGASTDPANPDQTHYENAWVFFSLFALVGLNVWMYWYLWKNRLPEEEPEIKVVGLTPRPIIDSQTPVQRKRASRERVKTPA